MIRLLMLFSLFIVLAFASCVTSHVPEGKFLLKKNKLEVEGDDQVDEAAMEKVIRQQPNLSTLKMKFRLIAYNSIDSSKVAERRIEKATKLREKNLKRKAREKRINERRKARAIRKGDENYYYRTIQPKGDTLNPKLSFRERIKYKFGEPPVIVDSALFERSKSQLSTYMHKKGYFYDTVTGYLDTLKDGRNKKIIPHFKVVTGPRYYIDSIYLVSDNPSVKQSFLNFIRKEQEQSSLNEPFHKFLADSAPLKVPFDEDVLSGYRDIVAKYMRNDAYYGFSPSHISYTADTTASDMSVKLGIIFTDRIIRDPDNPEVAITKRHAPTTVQAVYFHICDTILYKGNFSDYVENKLGLPDVKEDNLFVTVDTFYYAERMKKVPLPDSLQTKKGKRLYYQSTERNLFGQSKDSISLDKFRIATFYYNGDRDRSNDAKLDSSKQYKELPVKPGLIEAQNYLENTNYYKEYYADRTYNRLLQLGIFAIIKPVIEEVPGNQIVVHYYLVPAEKQSYSFQPRATNANGLLGVSASVNYANKNLFRSGWITTLTFSGGFESQPTVFQDNTSTNQSANFNTFEIGPTLKFDIPGLFPVNVAKLDKRQRPRTILSTAYNYQNRPDFSRGVFQLNYLWKFYVGKTQVVSVGLPGASVIKFVTLNPQPAFTARLEALNDQFLKNAYSDQFIWEDLKFVYEYDNRDSDKKKPRLRLTFNATFNAAGNLLYYGFRHSQAQDTNGKYYLLGVGYSQFALLDTKFITYYEVNKKHTLAFRIFTGAGQPYKNTTTSLPYDYSFFGGGSNDNRGWSARTLGPGAYKYYLDPTRTFTQIGDIRLGGSIEYRLGKGKLIQSAVFLDAGNIWTVNNDVNRPGSRFSPSWYKELGVAVGYGIRLDFDFFIFRVDLGFPIRNPGLPYGSRWVWDGRGDYFTEIANAGLTADQIADIPRPFFPKFHIGIGLPF